MACPSYRQTSHWRSGPQEEALQAAYALEDAASRHYYSPEEQAADEARWAQIEAEEAARRAIKATRAIRPVIPSNEYAPIRAACRNMLDCDRLQVVLDAGWTATDIKYLARQHSVVVGRRVRSKETPGAIRLVLELIRGCPAGRCFSFPSN
jgi:hypothetical protein